MKSLNQSIRQKRYRVKDSSSVGVVIETRTGTQLKLDLENCSLTGMGASLVEGTLPESEGLEANEIIPAAKLVMANSEVSLGRVVLRSIIHSDKICLGLSTVDIKLPIDGNLSKFLESDEGAINPYDVELDPDHFNISNFKESDKSNVDLFGRCTQFGVLFKQWTKTPKYQYHTIRKPSMGPRVKLTKKRKGRRDDYVIMGSNDYLGLAAHPDVVQAAHKALDEYGFGSTGSPLTTGLTVIHEELSEYLSAFFGKEKTLLFNSGYAANVGAIQGLTDQSDLILADYLSHASLADGMAMTKAKTRFFRHNNLEHLEKLLVDNREAHSGCLIITEGVFSMDGDTPPIEGIVDLAKKFNARLFVDEAHSLGVIGPDGRGLCHEQDICDDADVIMGTFSKICGGIGAFLSSERDVIDWLNWFARSHMFSVSVPPSTAAAALTAMKILDSEPERVKRLQDNIKHFVAGLRQLGCDISENHRSAVVPLIIGDEKKMGDINAILMDAGVFVVPIVYPAVSRHGCRFRFTIMSEHSTSDLDFVLALLESAFEKTGFDGKKASENQPLKLAG